MRAPEEASPEEKGWGVHLALVGAQTGFALFPIFGKLALGSIPPLVLAGLRVTTAALLLDLLRRASRGERIARADRRSVLLFALLGVSFNQILFILGLSMTSAIHTTILTAMIPVFTLGAAVLLGRERLTARAALAVLLAGTGALVLLRVERFDWSDRSLQGNLLLLANGLSYSFYLVLSRPILSRYRVLTIVAGVFLYGTPLILLVSLPSFLHFEPSRATPLAWASLAAVVLFCTVLPYLWNSWALARTKASRVAFYVFLQPLIASGLAVAILGERVTGRTLLAGGLILCGLAISAARERLPARPIP